MATINSKAKSHKSWVHIVFDFSCDKHKSDRDLIDVAREKVLHGQTYETSTANVDGVYELGLVWNPILSIEVPFASTDFVNLLQACDIILKNWARDLDRNIGLPFETNTLFRAPGKYNQVAVTVLWDEYHQTYHHQEIEIRRRLG